MDTSVAEMAVERALIIELVQQGAKIAEVRAQLFRRDRRIVPAVPLRRRAGSKCGRARARFANLPHGARFGFRVNARRGCARQAFHVLDELAGGLLSLAGIIGTEFDEQVSATFGKEVEVRGAFSLEAVDHAAFESFQADRMEMQNLCDMVGGEEGVVV